MTGRLSILLSLQWVLPAGDTLIWLGLVSIGMFVLSLISIPLIIVRIPEDYFCRQRESSFWKRLNPALRLILLLLKNVLGVILLLMGVLMLVLPGQGLLTILFGVALIDFPGKHILIRRLIAYPKVFDSINWIRNKANKQPLRLD